MTTISPVSEPAVDSGSRPSDTVRRSSSVAVCGLSAAVVLLLATMPAFYYPGDKFTPRAEASHWPNTGKFGIPYSQRTELAELVQKRGLYFTENDIRQRFYSKYAIAYRLLALTVEKLIAGELDLIHRSGSLLLLTLYSLLFTRSPSSAWERRAWP